MAGRAGCAHKEQRRDTSSGDVSPRRTARMGMQISVHDRAATWRARSCRRRCAIAGTPAAPTDDLPRDELVFRTRQAPRRHTRQMGEAGQASLTETAPTSVPLTMRRASRCPVVRKLRSPSTLVVGACWLGWTPNSNPTTATRRVVSLLRDALAGAGNWRPAARVLPRTARVPSEHRAYRCRSRRVLGGERALATQS